MSDFSGIISKEQGLPLWKVQNAIELLEDGKTIPFIARYRKEKTGELNEIQLREIDDRLDYLKKLESRKEEVLKLIEEKQKLTPELKDKIIKAETLQLVEDLYLPYKTRKKTRADIAREKDLEKLADFFKVSRSTDDKFIASFVDLDKEVNSIEEALAGARDIIAEEVSQNILARNYLREQFRSKGYLKSSKGDEEDPKGIYRDYYEFSQPVNRLVPHRIMAIFRGEKEKVLKVGMDTGLDHSPEIMRLMNFNSSLAYFDELKAAVIDSLDRLLKPSIEREIRSEIKEQAGDRAIAVFAKNIRQLLLQSPYGEKVILGLDPGYRTGCKVAVIDKDGSVIYHDNIFPTPPRNDKAGAAMKVVEAIRRLGIEIIVIGNGTASRETEQFVAETIKEYKLDCRYLIVSEAGASIYSASKVAIEEFPEYDVTTRGAISIARRIQDPLAEYVKITPESIGVGMYQHDVNKSSLKKSLDREVESVVNLVGVNLNTASEHLLKHISGLSPKIAKAVVEFRKENGTFKNRKKLLKVKGLGPKAYEQAAGFCRIIGGTEPLDGTTIHPESYEVALEVLTEAGLKPEEIFKKRDLLKVALNEFDIEGFAKTKELNPITVRDVVEALKKPGLDPREETEKPLLRSDVMTMEDLKAGMILEGTVRNVVDFGAFVDIGVKQDGLVHKTKMGRGVRDPLQVLSVGQIIEVKIISVEVERDRISLELVRNKENQ